MAPTDRVLVSFDRGVAQVSLNRPDKRNGLDLEMFEGLVAAGERVLGERGVRAVVLSGEGKAFCAGLDWQAFLAAGPDVRAKLLARSADRPGNIAQRICWIWQEIAVPVIAAVNGVAFGGGLQLALGADIRIVAPDARLSVMEIRYGLVPDMGATKTLLGLVRPDVARELTFTGRIVSGDDAVRLGLCTRTADDPLACAIALAREIAARSPDAIRAVKRLYQQASGRDVAGAFELETAAQLALLGTPAQMEAAMAALEKREPVFVDPA
jgi:enoyl-CoA hydratase/carnithine racemase